MENNNTPYNSNFLPDIKQNNDIHANSILLPTINGHPHQSQMIPQHLAHPNMYLMNIPQAPIDLYQQQPHQAQHPQQGPIHQPQQQSQQQQQQQNPLPPIIQPHVVLPHPYYQKNVHIIPQQQSQQPQHVQAVYPQKDIHPQPLQYQNYQPMEQRNLSSEFLVSPQPVSQISQIPLSSEQRSHPQSPAQVGQQQQHTDSALVQIDQPLESGRFKTEKNPKRVSSTSSPIKQQKKVSAFVTKLYSMLHDPSLSHLIWWSRLYQNDNTTFALLPGTEFASCLTTYFKHGNVASFVRQLHMYGFHKVCEGNQQHLIQNSYDQNHTIWEFRHTSGKFRRGDPSHLHLIKRRANPRRTSSNPDVSTTDSVNASANDVQGELLQQQKSVSSKDRANGDDNKSITQTRVVYKPVYYSADEIQETADNTTDKGSKVHSSGSKENLKQNFTAPAPKLLKDPFGKSQVDPPNRVLSPTSGANQVYHPAVPFQSVSAQQQHPQQVPPLPRPYSPTGRLSPVSYRQNVFFQESRQRYPSVFIDPCAPAPASTIPDRARSPPLPLPVISSQPQQVSQGFLMSPRNVRSLTDSSTSLPPISSISSHSSIPQSPGHSISSTKSGRFFFSRNSSAASSHTSQLRPSIFDLHHASSTTNSSISAQNSIFSSSSISSAGSVGSRVGSSISSILNDERRFSSFANGSVSRVSVPITSSSLKTVASSINEVSSSGRSETPESIANSISVNGKTEDEKKGDGKETPQEKVSVEPSRSTSKISLLLNTSDINDSVENLQAKENGGDLNGTTNGKLNENISVKDN